MIERNNVLNYDKDWDNINYNLLTGYYLQVILKKQPQLVDCCNLSKLQGWLLITHQPQFVKYCDWDKLKGCNWTVYLSNFPVYSKYCDWYKLDSWDWFSLLEFQPQFQKYRKIK